MRILPTLDSPALAAANRAALDVPRDAAAALGHSAVAITAAGSYRNAAGETVDIREAVATAIAGKTSLPPDAQLPVGNTPGSARPEIQVANLTTLQAARAMIDRGLRPLALNFANGVTPGGGFLNGARAQEEVLCRSSTLFATLDGDPMYAAHRARDDHESSAWCILSPRVPVFRDDAGTPLDTPYLLDFITCAAPVAAIVGQPRSASLMRDRIDRILAIARAYGYDSLILGAWGCGAFRNDPTLTAVAFREALEGEFRSSFAHITFAITDWSEGRKFLRPFRNGFSNKQHHSNNINQTMTEKPNNGGASNQGGRNINVEKVFPNDPDSQKLWIEIYELLQRQMRQLMLDGVPLPEGLEIPAGAVDGWEAGDDENGKPSIYLKGMRKKGDERDNQYSALAQYYQLWCIRNAIHLANNPGGDDIPPIFTSGEGTRILKEEFGLDPKTYPKGPAGQAVQPFYEHFRRRNDIVKSQAFRDLMTSRHHIGRYLWEKHYGDKIGYKGSKVSRHV